MKEKIKGVSRGFLLTLLLCLFCFTGCIPQDSTGEAINETIFKQGVNGSADTEVSVFSLDKNELMVQFIDVGQGSSALICQNNSYMLVDGGDRETASYLVSYLKQQGVKHLEYVVISHYDADHLGGIVKVLEEFSCNQVLAPDYETDTKLFASYQEIVEEKDISVLYPKLGASFSFENSNFQVVTPAVYGYDDSNSNSLGIRLEYENSSFLICGDATDETEQDVLYSGVELKSDVFAANHHGSRYSNSEEFLQAADPEAVVISCGKGNSYGHPHTSVLLNVQNLGASLYRTDLQGTITAVSDGEEIKFGQSPSMDYRCGDEIEEETEEEKQEDVSLNIKEYVLNTSTMKVHTPDCSSVEDMKQENRKEVKTTLQDLIQKGYEPCKRCEP